MWERIIMMLLPLILGTISPEIRNLLVEWVQNMERQAKATDNPYDDMFVAILKGLFQIPD